MNNYNLNNGMNIRIFLISTNILQPMKKYTVYYQQCRVMNALLKEVIKFERMAKIIILMYTEKSTTYNE